MNSGNQDYITWTPPTGFAPTGYRVYATTGGDTIESNVGAGTTQWRPAATFLPTTYTVRIATSPGHVERATQSIDSDTIRVGFFGLTYTC